MKITITYKELSQKCNDWNKCCSVIGLNPWAMNEGLVDGDDELTLTLEQAKECGLQWLFN